MKLEVVDYPVKDVKFGSRTGYKNGLLEINKEEMLSLILGDSRIVSAEIDIAYPSEKTRIVNVGDVIEPRIKVTGPGCVYPGIQGPAKTVGEGRTNKLSGMTVMVSLMHTVGISSSVLTPRSAVLDMWGPVARLTPFASMINVVLTLKLSDTLSEWESHATAQAAEFKVANLMAETTLDSTSDKVEVFELTNVDHSLPKVIYIFSSGTWASSPHSGMSYYGVPIRDSFPTLVHPNELFDGILTTDTTQTDGAFLTSWIMMNHPVVQGLYKEHGKRLNFLGMILQKITFETELGQQVSSQSTANMASLLGADAAIITKTTLSGAAFVELMLTVQACMQRGVKTVFMVDERGGPEGIDTPLLFYVPEAIAMVSTGSVDRQVEMPAPAKVIGAKKGELVRMFTGDAPVNPWGEMKTQQGWRNIVGGLDWLGKLNITCRSY